MDSKFFEKLIWRINWLLEPDGTSVKWNAKIPDPDNMDQTRQIDILIDRNNKTVLVECRHHKAPQDVKWIEELIGRQHSLRADEIIGVSSSGFTSGAEKKAKKFNIHLRHLKDLTIQDVLSWKEEAICYFDFFYIKKLAVRFNFYQTQDFNETLYSCTDLHKDVKQNRVFYNQICDIFFDRLVDSGYNLDQSLITDCDIRFDYPEDSLLFNGKPIHSVSFSLEYAASRRKVKLRQISEYKNIDTKASLATLENYAGVMDITRSVEDILLEINIDAIKLSPNEFFTGKIFFKNGGRRIKGFKQKATKELNVVIDNTEILLQFV